MASQAIVAQQLQRIDLYQSVYRNQNENMEVFKVLHNSRPKQVSLTCDFISRAGNTALQNLVDHLKENKSVVRLVLIDISPSTEGESACENRMLFFNYLAENAHLVHFQELVLKGGPDLLLSQTVSGLPLFIAHHRNLKALSIQTPCSFGAASIICENVCKSKLQSLHLSLMGHRRGTIIWTMSRHLAKCVGLQLLGLKCHEDIDEREFKALTVQAIPKLVNLKALEVDFELSDEGRPNNLEPLRDVLLLSSCRVDRLKVITSAPICTLDPVVKTLKVFHYRQRDKTMTSRDQQYLLEGLKDCELLEEVGLHVSGYVTLEVWIDLCAVLSQLPTLKRVTCLLGKHKWGDEHKRDALMDMVRTSSTIVQLPPRHHFKSFISVKVWDEICYVCECNRVQGTVIKDHLLRNETPTGLWSHVLAKLATKPRVLYTIIREKHDVLVKK